MQKRPGLNHVGVTVNNQRDWHNNEMAKIHDELEAAKQKQIE